MAELRKEYFKKKDELCRLAATGNYEHCLGVLEAIERPSVIQGVQDTLYFLPAGPTVESLPGMGYNLTIPKKFKVAGANIPDFSYKLYLKKNGSDYLKLKADLLKIKIQAEEDETLAIGRYITSCATLGLVECDSLPDSPVYNAMYKITAFNFGVAHSFAEFNAPIGDFLLNTVKHPLDSTESLGGNLCKFPEGVQKFLTTTTVFDLDRAGQAFSGFMTDKVKGLWEGGKEAFLDAAELAGDKGRFDAREGETLAEQVDRLTAKLDSAKKIKAATKTVQDITAIVVDFVISGPLAEKAWGKISGKTAAEAAQKAAVKNMQKVNFKLQSKAERALIRYKALKAEAELKNVKLAGGIDDAISKVKAAKNTEAFTDLARKNVELEKKIQDFVEAKPKTVKGKPVKSEGTIKVIDKNGNTVELAKGKKLGEGSFSTASVNAKNDAQVIRTTDFTEKGKAAYLQDEFGRKAIDEVNSPAIRMAKREGTYDVIENGVTTKHVEIVEKIDTTAKDLLAKQKGILTDGQKLAYEQSIRDLNAKGYAWIDNHHGNFSFEKLPGEDRWRVVVFDPGGIVKMQGKDLAEMASRAKGLQKKILTVVENEEINNFGKMLEILGDEKLPINVKAMGIDDVNKVGLAYKSGVRVNTGKMSELADDVLKKKYSVHTKAAIENLDEYKRLTASKEAVTKEMSSKVEEAGKTLEEIEKKVASLQKEVETTAKSTASASTSSSCDTKKLLNDAVILTKETCNTIGSLDCAAYMARWLSGTDPAKLGPNPCEEEVQVKGDEK